MCSKVWDADHGFEATLNALALSLAKLGLDYLDLCLLHSPGEDENQRHESWRALELAQRLNKVKSIGVSNFGAIQLRNLIRSAKVIPAVNQIELHPFCQRNELVQLCAQYDIKVESYSPLARGDKLEDPTVRGIARRYNRSPAQILLNWNASRGNIVLPKSLTAHRIRSNLNSFSFRLEDRDTQAIDELGEEVYVTGSMHKSED